MWLAERAWVFKQPTVYRVGDDAAWARGQAEPEDSEALTPSKKRSKLTTFWVILVCRDRLAPIPTPTRGREGRWTMEDVGGPAGEKRHGQERAGPRKAWKVGAEADKVPPRRHENFTAP